MNEGDTLSYQLFVFCIYVIDRDREGNARTGQDFALKQKHRQIGAGAHCDGFAIGDLEFDLEAEMPSVPVSRFLPIADWKPKAIGLRGHRTYQPHRGIALGSRRMCSRRPDSLKSRRGFEAPSIYSQH